MDGWMDGWMDPSDMFRSKDEGLFKESAWNNSTCDMFESYIPGYNPSYPFIRSFIGIITTPVITGDGGPPCMSFGYF